MNDLSLVKFSYKNYRGETSERVVRPIRLWFGSTSYYPNAQWLLEAFDLTRQETRDFSLEKIVGWERAADAAKRIMESMP